MAIIPFMEMFKMSRGKRAVRIAVEEPIPVTGGGVGDGGSAELIWLDTDEEPILDPDDRALGVMIDTLEDTLIVKYWTGSSWQEVSSD